MYPTLTFDILLKQPQQPSNTFTTLHKPPQPSTTIHNTHRVPNNIHESTIAINKMYGALTLALAALGAAAPASLALEARQAGTSEPLRFQGLALAQGTPIDSQTLNANDGKFSIGRATTTSGPEAGSGVDPSKFNTDQTIFAYLNGLSKLSLSSTAFPGGQQVYVTAGDESIGQLAGQLKVNDPWGCWRVVWKWREELLY